MLSSIRPQTHHHQSRPHRILVSTLTAALLALPIFTAGAAHAGIGDIIDRLVSRGNTITMERDTNGGRMWMRINGDVTFTATDDDVKSITGKVTIQEKRDGRIQRVTFEPDVAIGVKRTYSVNGQVLTPDADAKRWIAGVIPAMIRETAWDSENRIKRLRSAGGNEAVLAEIERIQSDFARRRYIEGLARQTPLDEKHLQRLIDTTAAVDSDFERRAALVAIIDRQTLNAAHQINLLKRVTVMDSAFEQRAVLTALTPKMSADPAVTQAWQDTLDSVDSDFELRTVIEALTHRDTLTPLQIELAIQSTQKLDSDFEHAHALKSVLRHLANATAAQISAYVQSAQAIDSDFERREALVSLVARAKLDKEGYAAVLRALADMSSDFEIRIVLTAIAGKMPADAELVSRYRRVARNLSDHERGQAEKALDHLNM